MNERKERETVLNSLCTILHLIKCLDENTTFLHETNLLSADENAMSQSAKAELASVNEGEVNPAVECKCLTTVRVCNREKGTPRDPRSATLSTHVNLSAGPGPNLLIACELSR
ncbi:hypothetical protein J6590_017909 [Homalodisca vitripennis]|nr:hypothetical protein J6590_017909 [Homalodisca vitripennis]